MQRARLGADPLKHYKAGRRQAWRDSLGAGCLIIPGTGALAKTDVKTDAKTDANQQP
jgi:hypothetical protein